MDEGQEFLAEAERVRQEQVGAQGGTPAVDPAVRGAVEHAEQTAGSAPEPGSGEPGLMGLGGLSASDIDAQKEDIARQQYAAPVPQQQVAPGALAGQGDALMSEAERIGNEQDFLAAAERSRQDQFGSPSSGPQVDPAVQAAVDHAAETAGDAPPQGSRQPGLMGLGGLSSGDIEAQKEEIARERYRGA